MNKRYRGRTSSRHGPCLVGYTRVTKPKPVGGDGVNLSKPTTFGPVRTVVCKVRLEVGIASNRGSARLGEDSQV